MDIRLRLAGLVLLCGAAFATHRLVLIGHSVASRPFAPGFVLALVAFLAASLGATLLATGAHIFDPIEISERWRRR